MRTCIRHSEDGSALIEFALCLPPLMLLMTGIFAFGIAISNYVMLTNATSSAAMDLAISRGNTTDPCALASNAIIAAAPTLKSSSFTYAYSLNGTAYSGTTCSSSSSTTGAAGNLVQGQSATITVTYPCNLAVFRANNFPSCVLTAKASELVQ
ncbi:MAG: pilus assembly protein [Acidobacteriota bacterium]|nr:pilus assembly protein [Acidobacteriota bacterium]